MKKIITICVLAALFSIGQMNAQFTFSVQPPSCPTCCDGTIIVTQTLCVMGAALGGFTPSLTLSTFTGNTLVYTNACCSDYTMTMIYPWKDCIPGPYTGTISGCFSGTGINESENNVDSRFIYPNPAKDKLYVNYNGRVTLKIYDLCGALMREYDSNEGVFELRNLASGLYYTFVYSNNGTLLSRKKLMIE